MASVPDQARHERWWRALLAVPLFFALLACGKDEAAQQRALLRHGVATGMRHNTLMDAAFGAENELVLPGEVYWQVELPLPQAMPLQQDKVEAFLKQEPAPDAEPFKNRQVAVRPREAVRLSETRLALVVESVAPSDLHARHAAQAASAATAAAHADDSARVPTPASVSVPAHIGVVFFDTPAADTVGTGAGKDEPGNEKWRAARLVPHVDYLRPGQTLPDVQVYKLNVNRYLITYVQTTCHAGVCKRWLKGYLLQPDAMTGIFETRLAGSNLYQYADCSARLGAAAVAGAALYEGQTPARPRAGAANKAPAHACHAIDGEVHLISRGGTETADVQIRYTGVVSEASGKRRRIAQTQLFRLEGDKLVQIEGAASPVPAHEPRS